MFRQSHSHPFSGLVLRIRPETVWGQTSQPVRRIQKHIRYYRQSSNFCPGLVLYGFCLKQIRNCYQKTQKLQNKTICFLNEWIVELHNCDLRRKLLNSLPNINLMSLILIKCHFLTKSPFWENCQMAAFNLYVIWYFARFFNLWSVIFVALHLLNFVLYSRGYVL